MSKFTQFTGIKSYKEKWITTGELIFYINNDCTGEYIRIPKGFIFDGCSISICLIGAKVNPKTIKGCLLHDYCFHNKLGFFFSNMIFFKALRACNVSLFRSIIYYLGVTLFGYFTYLKKS